jgi:hypothetical protein
VHHRVLTMLADEYRASPGRGLQAMLGLRHERWLAV